MLTPMVRVRRKVDEHWLQEEIIRAIDESEQKLEPLAEDMEITRAALSRYYHAHGDMKGRNIAKLIDLLGLKAAVVKALRGNGE